MFHVLILTFSFASAVDMPDHPPLGPKGPPLMIKVDRCCAKNLLRHDEMDMEVIKECLHMDKKTCEKDICIAKKKGYASPDGTIDKKVLQENMEKDFKDINTVALEGILDNCINGDPSKFGEEDFCELMKMSNCIEIQIVKSCDDWKESEDCKKLKASVDSLIKKFE